MEQMPLKDTLISGGIEESTIYIEALETYIDKEYESELSALIDSLHKELGDLKYDLTSYGAKNVPTEDHIYCYALYLSILSARLGPKDSSELRLKIRKRARKDANTNKGKKVLVLKTELFDVFEGRPYEKSEKKAIHSFFASIEEDVRTCGPHLQDTGEWLELGLEATAHEK